MRLTKLKVSELKRIILEDLQDYDGCFFVKSYKIDENELKDEVRISFTIKKPFGVNHLRNYPDIK